MIGAFDRASNLKTFLTKWLAWCTLLFAWRMWIVFRLNQPGAYDGELQWAGFMSFAAALVNFVVVLPAAGLFLALRGRSSSRAMTFAASAVAALVVVGVPGCYASYSRPRAVQRIVPQLNVARQALGSHLATFGTPPRRATDLPGVTPLHTIRGCTALDVVETALWSVCHRDIFGNHDVISTRREPDWDGGHVVQIAPGWWYHRSPLVP